MNDIDLNEILKIAADFWPKTTSTELGLLQKVIRAESFETVKDAIEAVRLKSDYKTLPLAAVKTKLFESKRKDDGESDHYDENWKDCYFVCTEFDRENEYFYIGKLIEIAFPNKGRSDDEFIKMMAKEVYVWRERYKIGLCRFEFFVGKENHTAATARATAVFREAFNSGLLPDKFYTKTNLFGETHETQPGEVPHETEFAEFDPDNPDSLPF